MAPGPLVVETLRHLLTTRGHLHPARTSAERSHIDTISAVPGSITPLSTGSKTWFGDVVTAAALADDEAAGEATSRMSEWAGEKPRPASMTEVGRRLRDLGDGSTAVVGFDLHGGGGHWFNAVNYEGTVLAVDGQSGRHEKWPPSIAGLGFDGSKMSDSEAIFFTPEGVVVRDDH